jgi:hypothetical protein
MQVFHTPFHRPLLRSEHLGKDLDVARAKSFVETLATLPGAESKIQR